MHAKLRLLMGALSLTLLLSGCGGQAQPPAETPEEPQTPPAETPAEPRPDLAELRSINDPLEILKTCDRAAVQVENQDGAGNVTSSGVILYRRDAAGELELDSRMTYFGVDGEEAGVFYEEAYRIADGQPGAYYYEDGETVSMNCYPSGEYEQAIAGMLPPRSNDGLSDGETVEGWAEQDGALVLTTSAGVVELDLCWETDYYLEPETFRLLAMVRTDYASREDRTVTGVERWNWSYDGMEPMDWSYPNIGAGSAEDSCALTFVIDPGQETEEIQSFLLRRDTQVSFIAEDGCTVYADKAMTQEVSPYVLELPGESVTYYVVLTGSAA